MAQLEREVDRRILERSIMEITMVVATSLENGFEHKLSFHFAFSLVRFFSLFHFFFIRFFIITHSPGILDFSKVKKLCVLID